MGTFRDQWGLDIGVTSLNFELHDGVVGLGGWVLFSRETCLSTKAMMSRIARARFPSYSSSLAQVLWLYFYLCPIVPCVPELESNLEVGWKR